MVDKTLDLKVDEKGESKRVIPSREKESGNSFYLSLIAAGAAASTHPSTYELGIPALIVGLSPFVYDLTKEIYSVIIRSYDKQS